MSRAISLVTKPGSKLLNRFLTLPAANPILHHSTRTLETLAFEEVLSSPDKPYTYTAFILHGLLGSGRNWRSFSRSLASSLSGWRMVMVDLRNHGKSAEITGLSPPHTIGSAARDLADLVKSKGWDWPAAVIGHSLGGKVALDFAQSCARGDYGEHACLPKQSSYGYWTQSLEKWTLRKVMEKWSKFCRPCNVYLHQYHLGNG